jgi:propanol-preferring alcohol dehydrogenase
MFAESQTSRAPKARFLPVRPGILLATEKLIRETAVKKMKAWVLNTPAPVDQSPLVLSEINKPTPSEDEVLLRVNACGICRTDLHVVEGELPVRRSPLVPGHQIVGRVAAVGSKVEGFAEGDRVGVAWLNRTCGVCEFCVSGQENVSP